MPQKTGDKAGKAALKPREDVFSLPPGSARVPGDHPTYGQVPKIFYSSNDHNLVGGLPKLISVANDPLFVFVYFDFSHLHQRAPLLGATETIEHGKFLSPFGAFRTIGKVSAKTRKVKEKRRI